MKEVGWSSNISALPPLPRLPILAKQRHRERPGAGEGLSGKFLSGTSDQSD